VSAAVARQQDAVEKAVTTMREIGDGITQAASSAAAEQQATAGDVVKAVREIGGDLSHTTRDLAATTQQLAQFRRLLSISIAIGIFALVAGAAALGIALR